MENFMYKDAREELKLFVLFTQLLDFTDQTTRVYLKKIGNVMKNQRSLFLYINTLGFESNLDSHLFHFQE